MTETIKTLLEPIQNRLNAATPGPWEDRVDDLTEDLNVWHDQEQVSFVAFCGDKNQPRAQADAEFIANAPTDQARLLAAVRAVVAEIADTDLETNEAQQGDLSDRILVAIESALAEAH